MKLTKKLEAEILKAYHSYWDSYLKGDMKTFASLLDEDCHIIGSTAFDVFDNKKPAVEFYTATAEQISDKGEFRNRKIKVLPYDENVMVQELHDFYFLQEDEWRFYGHGRVSTLFSKKEGSWKIIHQHGSLPDSQAEKGEQMGMEKISRENRELREAVKRRTVELEHKNYELEIESSLERVRTVAMAMQNPNDLLRICETVFYELEKLGFIKLRNAMINIHDDAKGSFLNYDFSAYAGKTITTIFYNSNPMVQNHVKQIKSSTNAFAEMVVTGKELADWREFRKENGEQDDPRLANITSLYYYFYSVVKGDLGISNFEPVSEMQLAVLKRFSNVFDLAYKRYTDITKAEAQAREARIEAALEKVRSRTMAMQRSDELIETSSVLYHQLKELNEKPEGITIAVINEEENAFDLWITGVEGLSINQKFKVSTQEPVMYKIAYNSWKQQQKSLVVEMAGSDLTEFMAYLKQINFPVNDNVDIHKKVNTCAFFSKGYISIITLDLLPQETIRLLERFAGVFDQTYTRFLDLQKAEEQAREAKIEAALERTRTQSMLMQHSKELDDTLRVFHEQVLLLGIKSAFSFLWLPDESKDRHIFWAVWAESLAVTQTVKNGSRVLKSKAIDYPLDRNEPATAQCLIDWKGDEPVVSYHVPPAGVESYFAAWQELIAGVEKLKPEYFSGGLYYVEAFMKYGCFGVMVESELPQEEKKILSRFAIEFERAYTRFLDLQKAEAQAREATIEAALERVRSRSMAMHKSEELKEIIQVVYEQFLHLNILVEHAGFIMDYKERDDMHIWLADQYNIPSQITIPYFDSPHWNSFIEAKEKGLDFFANHLGFEEKNKFYQGLFKLFPGVADEAKDYYFNSPGLAISTVLLENIGLYIENFSAIPYTDEENATLMRFGKVFQQTYTRFLDLQKAEAQAREAKIEAALEKVRSRTMGMQLSEELGDVATVLFKELNQLVENLWTCGFVLCERERPEDEWWLSTETGFIPAFYLPNTSGVTHANIYQGWLNGESYHTEQLEGEALKEHYEWLMNIPVSRKIFEEMMADGFTLPTWRKLHCAYFSQGYLVIITQVPCPEELIFKRFAQVFDLTYTRFLDLQKAELQAREAKIEVALEKIRSRSLGMHRSVEIKDVVSILFEKLKELDLAFDGGAAIHLFTEGSRHAVIWVASPDLAEPTCVNLPYDENAFESNPIITDVWNAKETGEDIYNKFYSLEEKNTYFDYVFKHNDLITVPKLSRDFILQADSYTASFIAEKNSLLGANSWTRQLFSDNDFIVLKRIARVFEQAYIRFLDLQKAEAQSRESQIEAALERVRSRTLAMQKSDELAETAAVLFKQLINLGIAPNRLYIGIVRDDDGHIEFWVTDEDGSKVSTQFIGDTSRNASMRKMYDEWKEGRKSLTIDMHGKELADYFHYLADELNVPFKEGLSQKRRLQSIAYFGKGFIGIASPEEQPPETISLLERFAAVFNLTYTRFNDLKIAETHAEQAELDLLKLKEEKKRTEDALAELQITQKQLIQSEKMASLGELTAGIAHEIQNPLNFVNNFSEISNELIDEMMEEVSKGNYAEVKAIADDVKQNLGKINHHGKRADGIVKGMLQHSRISSGQREPTDINVLADEYLRLAYHGLRAKDKTFNAMLKTDYDETIGNIEIIPQDIGRVILNLITNAFYVVAEKKKSGIDKYEPTVTLGTIKVNDTVEIKVKDNGNGIPQQILDKIFQPFFTTKPTGQGTGLGLSLAYDIVKAHSGELKVETQQGKGTTFIISIPITKL